jgi:hypothetical protein
LPEGRRKVRGKRLTGMVLRRKLRVVGWPFAGKYCVVSMSRIVYGNGVQV